MWEKIYGYFRGLWQLVDKTDRHAASIDRLSEVVEDLQREVLTLQAEVRRVEEVGAERDKRILLEVENMLLKFERRLPPQS